MSGNKGSKYPSQFHSKIDFRPPPPSLVALREELPKHPDIFEKANKGRTFEDCLAIIAAELRIVLDGYYDAADLCDLLVSELKQRGALVLVGSNGLVSGNIPHDARLVPARIVETKNAVRLENAGLIVPEGVRQEQVEKQLAVLTKEAVETANAPAVDAATLKSAVEGDDVWISVLIRKPVKTGNYQTKFADETFCDNYYDAVANNWWIKEGEVLYWCEPPLPTTLAGLEDEFYDGETAGKPATEE